MKPLLLCSALLAAVAARAGVPGYIAHEGRLLKADGTPEGGSVELTFRLYKAPTGDPVEWTETQSVTLSPDGYYSALLGRAFPLPPLEGTGWWLGVTVTGESEMSPRAPLASVPFALRAGLADDARKLGGDASSEILRRTSPLNAALLTGTAPAAIMPPEVPKLTDGKLDDAVLSANVPTFPSWPVLRAPAPAGASGAIIDNIIVNASSTCGTSDPAPHMEVYVNGAWVAGTNITAASWADHGPFLVAPPRYASEVAVAYTNDKWSGGCDHNIDVNLVKLLATDGSTVTLNPRRNAHVIYDLGDGASAFDGIDVVKGWPWMYANGALRFFVAPAPTGPAVDAWSAERTGYVPPDPVPYVMTTIPGLLLTINLRQAALVLLWANGTQRSAKPGSYSGVCHVGLGFKVDGALRGYADYGSRIHQSSIAWNTWTVMGSEQLGAGTHTIEVQAKDSWGSCFICAEWNGAPVLEPYSGCTLHVLAVYH